MADNITIKEAVNSGSLRLKECNIDNAAHDSFVMLSDITGIDRTHFLIYGDEHVSDEDMKLFNEYISRRCSHEPLQYILGKAWFYGRQYIVDRNVLIPRSDTEVLIEQALNQILNRGGGSGLHILDMCTGSGCIAITLALELKDSQVVAADLSNEALSIARKNCSRLAADNVSFVQSDLFERLADYKNHQFDLIVSNPPYIETDVINTLEAEVRLFEPVMALDGMSDGLYFYRKITGQATHFLRNGGWLMYEIGYNQGEAVRDIMEAAGFENIEVTKDYAGLDRVVKGRIIV